MQGNSNLRCHMRPAKSSSKSNAKAAALALIAACTAAQAQQLPSAIELRATYCVAVLQFRLALFNSMPPDTPAEIQSGIVEEKERASANLRRLQGFLAPRVPHLEPASLALALDAGDQDAEHAAQEAARCVDRCADEGDAGACLHECREQSAVMTRVQMCDDTSWYPI
jgi:hypothetical protein